MGAIARLLNLREGEAKPTLLAGLGFFFVLFGYFLLRPVREAMGVERGMDELRWLFVATLVAMIPANAAYGWVVARFPRRVLVPTVYRFVIVCLVGFALLRHLFPGIIGERTGQVFFVWISVANLFLTSLFWVTLADGFSLERSKRLYPAIGVGGTLGAIAGGAVNTAFAETFSVVWFFLGSIVLVELSVRCLAALRREYEDRSWRGRELPGPIGGNPIQGATLVAKSGYLLGIGGYIFLLAIANTLLYFITREIVLDTGEDTSERQRLFGIIDLTTQSTTLVLQLFVTGRLMRRLGPGFVLTLLPVITIGVFTALVVSPVFAVSKWCEAAFRAGKYALARPARETLFTVVDDAEKLKAKPFVDTFVYRAGDGAGVAVEAGTMAWAKSLASLSAAVAPLAVVASALSILWGGLGVVLGVFQRKRAHRSGAS